MNKRIEEIRERLKKATPGLKTVERFEGFSDDTFRYEINEEGCLVAFHEENHKPSMKAKFNAELFAAASTDIEYLLGKLEKAMGALKKIKEPDFAGAQGMIIADMGFQHFAQRTSRLVLAELMKE